MTKGPDADLEQREIQFFHHTVHDTGVAEPVALILIPEVGVGIKLYNRH